MFDRFVNTPLAKLLPCSFSRGRNIPTVKNAVIHLISWCGNCAFSQNFHTRKLNQITVFYAVPFFQQRYGTPGQTPPSLNYFANAILPDCSLDYFCYSISFHLRCHLPISLPVCFHSQGSRKV